MSDVSGRAVAQPADTEAKMAPARKYMRPRQVLSMMWIPTGCERSVIVHEGHQLYGATGSKAAFVRLDWRPKLVTSHRCSRMVEPKFLVRFVVKVEKSFLL